MTREQFANFLKELKKVKEKGQDIDAFVKTYEHKNVYFYNDGCIKKILASEKNLMLTTDLLNAALNLIGSDRIENPKLVNPFIPGELGYRNVEPDILLMNERGGDAPRDRVSIEVQHKGDLQYKDRLVLYVARLTSNMVKKNEKPQLENLHVVSFQFFNAFKDSPNYRHTVQLRNQEQQVYFDRQTVTLIEVEKFLRESQKFASDNSRLAQWLRAIDSLNREADFSEFENDSVFKVLRNEVKLCNFSARYLMTVDMSDFDKAIERYETTLEIAKKMLENNEPVQKIISYTGLSVHEIQNLK
jgi:predicted transposase/invertase (TIGR01784 family)